MSTFDVENVQSCDWKPAIEKLFQIMNKSEAISIAANKSKT